MRGGMMAARKPNNSLVSLVQDAPPRSIEERGRVLYVEDVQDLLEGQTGKRPSRWWVNHSFAPEYAFKVGRANAWWEADVMKWLDSRKRRVS